MDFQARMVSQDAVELMDAQGRRDPRVCLVHAVILAIWDQLVMKVPWDPWDHLEMMLKVETVSGARKVSLEGRVQEDQLVSPVHLALTDQRVREA